jgi:hypothetical protein
LAAVSHDVLRFVVKLPGAVEDLLDHVRQLPAAARQALHEGSVVWGIWQGGGVHRVVTHACCNTTTTTTTMTAQQHTQWPVVAVHDGQQ